MGLMTKMKTMQTLNFPLFEAFNRVVESGNTRIHRHILGEEPCAMLSAFCADCSEAENLERMSHFKADVRKLGYGYIHLLFRYVQDGESSDERALLIPKCTAEDAINLGKKYGQPSVIVHDVNGCREICTAPETYVEGCVGKSKVTHLIEIYEIEDPRPSYFQTHESKTLLWKQDK